MNESATNKIKNDNSSDSLNPVWERLHEHDSELRTLEKSHAETFQRVKGTEQIISNVREELKEWKDQTHRDSEAILAELRSANKYTQTVSEKTHQTAATIQTLKWVIPVTVTATGVLFGILTFLVKAGLLG